MVGPNAERGHTELVRRIGAAGERWKRRTAGLGAVRTVTFVLASLAVLAAVDSMATLPFNARIAWLAVTAAFLGFGLTAWVARPLLRTFDPVELAARIEERAPELGERLESAAELWGKRGTGRHGYSVELIDALITKTVAEASGLDFRILTGSAALRRTWRSLAVVVAASVIIVAILGQRLAPALYRMSHPLEAP
ncbi:MAG: hypothetical protein JXB46_08165, partial [Candidatus Eisenbacteria bacterium]|nr:hypothetical protein [Candidatus Eisenbacteria bacterium]